MYSSDVFRLHKCQVLFPIVREGFYPEDDLRRVEMVNWTALLGLVHGVVVETSRHWIVHVETLYGRSPGELFGLAKNLGDRVAQALMTKYGVLLDQARLVTATSWLLMIISMIIACFSGQSHVITCILFGILKHKLIKNN